MESRSWKCVAVLSCLVALTLAKESQLKLEDIERDTLSSEKQFQQQVQQIQQQHQQQQLQLQPQQLQQQRVQTIQQLPPRPYFATVTATPQPPPPPPPQVPQGPPELSTGPHQFSPEARLFPPPPPLQLQFPSRTPQQQFVSVPLLSQQGHEQQFQFQFLPGNSLQDYNIQNYFSSPSTPNYVYVQQPGNSIPVNNKQGGIEYVQYIDPNTELLNNPKTQSVLANHHHKATHNLAGLIQRNAYTNVLPQNYRQPAPQTYRVQGAAQPLVNQNLYVIPPPQPLQQPNNQIHGLYQQANQVLSQQRYLIPTVLADRPQSPFGPPAPPQNQFDHQQAQQSTANVVYQKREPQSLLESYVPSVLQIQYFKELQKHQQNALQQGGKISGVVGKSDVVKGGNDFQFQFQ